MTPDNRLLIQYGLTDAEFRADSSGTDAEINRMFLIYRGLRSPSVTRTQSVNDQLRTALLGSTVWKKSPALKEET